MTVIQFILRYYYLTLLVIALIATGSVSIASSDDALERGETAYQQGHFAKAIAIWQPALPDNPTQAIPLVLKITAAQQANGALLEAIALLEQYLPAAHDPTQQLLIRKQLADSYRLTQQLESAQTQLTAALAQLDRQPFEAELSAAILHSQAQLFATQGFYQKAIRIYQQALQHAKTANMPVLRIKILLNQVQVHTQLDTTEPVAELLKTAFQHAQQLPNHYDKAFLLLAIAQRSQMIGAPLETQALTAADTLATQLKHPDLQTYAKGYIGDYYLRHRRHAQALTFTRQAIFYAQLSHRANNPQRYRWHWQLAKIFRAQQETESALTAYAQAVAYLQPIRQTLISQQQYFNDSFTQSIAQVYLEFIDVLLQKSDGLSGAAQQAVLKTVLETLEQLKAAELEDYFQAPCVTPWQTSAEILAQHTSSAALYPIVLPQRIVLLLQHAGKIMPYTIAVKATQLTYVLDELRFEMQTVATQDFLTPAQQLYTWLLAPLEAYLEAQAITTLVLQPDEQLRNVPLAILHDGQQFAVQKWAFAVTPGLQLTAPPQLKTHSPKIMLNGLSEGVQGFTPLPAVSNELRQIQQLYGESSVFLNEGFVLGQLESALQQAPYQVVHIASHGEFSSDPQQTFILTYDDKLRMNRLESLLKFNQSLHEPIDLLTLSACKTAYGDNRAALGLAGVAVKAGTRSALATLWYVDDKATADLIVQFYRYLRQPNTPKAQALQLAQLHMLHNPNYRHPLYWGGFLLVGSWL